MSSKGQVCVACGDSINQLHKKYGEDIIKLTQCKNCHEIADKYLEYDNVIILIDIILLNRRAYRHIIYNIDFQNHWKLAILLLMLKSYNNWEFLTNSSAISTIFFNEFQVYKCFFITFTGEIVNFTCIFSAISIYFKMWLPHLTFLKLLIWKAVVMSNMGNFLLLSSLIWENSERTVHLIFVTIYVLISQMQALSVTTSIPRGSLFAISLTCTLVSHWTTYSLTKLLV